MSFLGSKHDESISDQIISGVVMRGNKDISFSNLCGTLPFLESLRRLAESQVYIGIDSALLHYARILRVRCISYWGPSNPELRLLPIPHLQETVHYKRLICSPCVHVAELAPCRGHALCMKQFTEAVSPEDSNILKNVTFTPDGARSPQAKEDRT